MRGRRREGEIKRQRYIIPRNSKKCHYRHDDKFYDTGNQKHIRIKMKKKKILSVSSDLPWKDD